MDDFTDQLKDWHKALESEFQAKQAEVPDDLGEALRQRLRKHVLELGDNIVNIAKYSDSDQVRLAATKYAISIAIPNPESGQTDPLAMLLKDLAKND